MTGVLGPVQYSCADCGRDASLRAPSTPCLCGSTARLRADPEDSYRLVSDRALPWFDPFKDWTVKYLQFTWNVQQLRHAYTVDDGGTAERLCKSALITFTSCAELADWLVAGPEPVSVTPGALARLFATEPLSVTRALKPEGGGAARLVPVAFSRPPHAWVDYRRPEAKPVRYDALDLAERCLDAWHQYLHGCGVAVPSWER